MCQESGSKTKSEDKSCSSTPPVTPDIIRVLGAQCQGTRNGDRVYTCFLLFHSSCFAQRVPLLLSFVLVSKLSHIQPAGALQDGSCAVKIWVLDVLIATRLSWFLGLLSRESWDVCVRRPRGTGMCECTHGLRYIWCPWK